MLGFGAAGDAPLLSLLTALVAGLVARRLVSRERLSATAPLVLAIAFCAGWIGIYSWKNLVPSRHYHWTFSAAIAAGLVGAWGPKGWKSVVFNGVVAVGAAFFFVPTWKALAPTRPMWIVIVAALIGLVACRLPPLGVRIGPRIVVLALIASASLLSALVAAAYSLTFGFLAGLAASALIGWTLATWSRIDAESVRRVALFYAVIVVGASFIAAIEPKPPAVALLAVPLAPLSLWLMAFGPLARLQGARATGAALAIVALSLTVVGGWIVVQSGLLSLAAAG